MVKHVHTDLADRCRTCWLLHSYRLLPVRCIGMKYMEISLPVIDSMCCDFQMPIFTSAAKELMFYLAFVCLSVCQCVCLLAASRKNCCSDLRESSTRDVGLSVDKEQCCAKYFLKVFKIQSINTGWKKYLKYSEKYKY